MIVHLRTCIPSASSLKILEFQDFQTLEGGISIFFWCQANLSLLLWLVWTLFFWDHLIVWVGFWCPISVYVWILWWNQSMLLEVHITIFYTTHAVYLSVDIFLLERIFAWMFLTHQMHQDVAEPM